MSYGKVDFDKHCNGCINLITTEAEQCRIYLETHEKKPHMCRRYGQKLYHLKMHPEILRCERCLENDGYETE